MDKVRIGIIGVGNMGSTHARSILANNIPGLELTALCDLNSDKLAAFPQVKHFSSSAELIRSGLVDAILVATPHYDHTTIGIDGLNEGLHVLVEKPLSVHKADCERMLTAYESRPKKSQVFGAMFNQRTDPHYQKVREMIQSGELGQIRRITWNITDWFRPYAYYASGGWRATWAGEGGGVLLNQCPHNLDLWWWMFGKPKTLKAWCKFGFYHDTIEVEDDVTAYMEYADGAKGVFMAATGEAPGSNRLEISAERGKLIVDFGVGAGIKFIRNEVPTTEFSKTTKGHFSRPDTWNIDIPIRSNGEQHNGILKNFTNAILKGETLMAPAIEGIHSVELANAMLYSTFVDTTVNFPLDSAAYAVELKKKIAGSKLNKKVETGPAADFSSSFGAKA
ncbi:MAG: Gfo/Idh/MocA family oxidoreductase [Verrucomicrobiota bacterium]|nr:Gfo/Idh/MocA family oxidoreductase [Verrucomicrobiota bacterium]